MPGISIDDVSLSVTVKPDRNLLFPLTIQLHKKLQAPYILPLMVASPVNSVILAAFFEDAGKHKK